MRFRDGLDTHNHSKCTQHDNENVSPASQFKLNWKVPDDGRDLYERGIAKMKTNYDRREKLNTLKQQNEYSNLSFRPKILETSKRMVQDKQLSSFCYSEAKIGVTINSNLLIIYFFVITDKIFFFDR